MNILSCYQIGSEEYSLQILYYVIFICLLFIGGMEGLRLVFDFCDFCDVCDILLFLRIGYFLYIFY